MLSSDPAPELITALDETTSIDEYPWATQLVDEVLFYSAAALAPTMADAAGRRVLEEEIARALSIGPGVVVFTDSFDDVDLIDVVSAEFDDLIEESRSLVNSTERPHSDRVPHALDRLVERNPTASAQYYANDVVALAAHAWLGPGYQMSSLVNVVNPGAPASQLHPSDELALLPAEVAETFPVHSRRLSSELSLRGVVAHTDMPVESGPPTVLPHSHKVPDGHVVWRQPDFEAFASSRAAQIALFKGDIMFVNPAVLHGAGANTTRTVRRMANVLTITSALGRPIDGS